MVDVFQLSWTLEQFDPKDKLYGLLGLLEESIAEHVGLDCDLAVEAIYTKFARAVVRGTGKLDILLQTVLQPAKLQPPSWIPDFRGESGRVQLLPTKAFYADREMTARVTFPHEGLLSCTGFWIDVVDALSCSVRETAMDLHPVVQPLNKANAYDSEEAFRVALWQTLMGGEDFSTDSDPFPAGLGALLGSHHRLRISQTLSIDHS